MEIKRFIPEIAVVGASEVAASGFVIDSYLKGGQITAENLALQYGFWTFYVGVPAAIGLGMVIEGIDWIRKNSKRNH